MNKIKLFITDVDGVWTDGGMYYDQTGNELKKFNTSDSAGVLFLKLLGIPSAIITGENTEIVPKRAEKLNIEYVFMGVTDKVKTAQQLCDKMGVTFNEVAFIGDDINDILLLQKVGLSATPSNAPDYVKKFATWNLSVKGGEGAFRAFVERYLKEIKKLDNVIEQYLEQTNGLKQ